MILLISWLAMFSPSVGTTLVQDSPATDLGSQVIGSPSAANITFILNLTDGASPKRFRGILIANGQAPRTFYSGDTNILFMPDVPTDVDENPNGGIPTKHSLAQNYPNPFNPSTNIEFHVKDQGNVELSVYNLLGQEIKTLVSAILEPGAYRAVWFGENNVNMKVAAGIYIYTLRTEGHLESRKMVNLGSGKGTSSYSRIASHRINIGQGTPAPDKPANFTHSLEIKAKPDSTRPMFTDTTVHFNLSNDTTIMMLLPRYLVPVQLNAIPDKTINEDEMPPDPRFADLWQHLAAAFDSSGNPVPASAVQYLIVSQSRQGLVDVGVDQNRYLKINYLGRDSSGTSNITVRAVAPNSRSQERTFAFIVSPMPDISGKVDSLFSKLREIGTQNRGPVDSVVVRFGVDSVYTDSSGNYRLQVPPGTTGKLSFEKGGFHTSKTGSFTAANDTTLNRGIPDQRLNMEFFDFIARSIPNQNGGTARWTTVPNYYININDAIGGGQVTQAMIDTVLAILHNDVPEFTHGYISNPNIVIGTNPPPYGENNWIRVEWDNTIPGTGEHWELLDTSTNRLHGGYAKFRTIASRGTMLQEILQNLGPRRDSNIVPSIFNTGTGGHNYILDVDRMTGKLLYTRQPKLRSPDDGN